MISDGLTLLTGADGQWGDAASRLPNQPPVHLAVLPPSTLHALGIRPHGALLVRPDAVPVTGWYRADTVDRAAADLTQAIDDLLAPTPPSDHSQGATR